MGRKSGWVVGLVATLFCLVAGSFATWLLLRPNGLVSQGVFDGSK
jgi:hypothetical protein